MSASGCHDVCHASLGSIASQWQNFQYSQSMAKHAIRLYMSGQAMAKPARQIDVQLSILV